MFDLPLDILHPSPCCVGRIPQPPIITYHDLTYTGIGGSCRLLRNAPPVGGHRRHRRQPQGVGRCIGHLPAHVRAPGGCDKAGVAPGGSGKRHCCRTFFVFVAVVQSARPLGYRSTALPLESRPRSRQSGTRDRAIGTAVPNFFLPSLFAPRCTACSWWFTWNDILFDVAWERVRLHKLD